MDRPRIEQPVGQPLVAPGQRNTLLDRVDDAAAGGREPEQHEGRAGQKDPTVIDPATGGIERETAHVRQRS